MFEAPVQRLSSHSRTAVVMINRYQGEATPPWQDCFACAPPRCPGLPAIDGQSQAAGWREPWLNSSAGTTQTTRERWNGTLARPVFTCPLTSWGMSCEAFPAATRVNRCFRLQPWVGGAGVYPPRLPPAVPEDPLSLSRNLPAHGEMNIDGCRQLRSRPMWWCQLKRTGHWKACTARPSDSENVYAASAFYSWK